MSAPSITDGDSGATVRALLNLNMQDGHPFRKTVTLTSAAAATPVEIVPAADVGAGKKVYVTDFLVAVDGAVAWSDDTGTVVNLQDDAGTPVVGAEIAKAGLTASALLGKLSTNVTLGDAIALGEGFTEAKGLDVAADDDFTAGSDLVVTVSGFIGAA